jgi:hypothetical protein
VADALQMVEDGVGQPPTQSSSNRVSDSESGTEVFDAETGA